MPQRPPRWRSPTSSTLPRSRERARRWPEAGFSPRRPGSGRARSPSADGRLSGFQKSTVPARTCVMEVRASEEFSPIKNADGKESPDSSRAALIACYRNWLKGVQIPPSTEAPFIEIDHSIIESRIKLQNQFHFAFFLRCGPHCLVMAMYINVSQCTSLYSTSSSHYW